jgi:hypothetical protein
MNEQNWEFAAGARVPRWLVETVDCTVIFNWSALVVELEDKWKICPTEPVRRGAPPFLIRPATERRRGAAVPTRDFVLSYEIAKNPRVFSGEVDPVHR